jgi:hypothetical protein
LSRFLGIAALIIFSSRLARGVTILGFIGGADDRRDVCETEDPVLVDKARSTVALFDADSKEIIGVFGGAGTTTSSWPSR